MLSSSESNILEDENTLNILSSSKILSEEIQAKQIIAVSNEADIDKARNHYIPVARHSVTLFFGIIQLANINPMYQYSLDWFLALFSDAITKASKSTVLSERLQHLNNYFTKSIYQNVCRSLFEEDRLALSMIICLSLQLSEVFLDKLR